MSTTLRHKMTSIPLGVVISFIIFLAIAQQCTDIPSQVGKSHEIVVVSTVIDSQLINNNLQIYNYVPQREALFRFLFIPDSLIDTYRKHHTILLYGSLDDTFIDILLRDDAKETTRKDTFALFKLDDLWTRGQLAIILVVSKTKYIQKGMEKYKKLITTILEENYYDRIKENVYTKGISKRLKKRLEHYGVTFDISKEWLIDSTYSNQRFIFVHAHYPDRSIFFYKKLIDQTLSDSFIVATRNALTSRFYNGDYILTDLTYIEEIEFNGLKGKRVKGIWQNDTLVAGGPFLSYFLVDNDTLFIVDGMLFNPGERKSDYFTRLEVIMNSVEIIGHEKQP